MCRACSAQGDSACRMQNIHTHTNTRTHACEQGWKLPLPPLSPDDLEPVLPFCDPGEEGARHEACLKLVDGADYVAKFACRAAGDGVGQWRREGGGSRSALADPYAKPDERFVEVCVALYALYPRVCVFWRGW